MFDTGILHFFSFTPWYMVPICYTPMILYYLSLSIPLLSVTSLILFFILGMFYFSFCEYFFHRFAFHAEETWLPSNNIAFGLHFMFHGVHHAYPMDRFRLVFPPVLGFFLH